MSQPPRSTKRAGDLFDACLRLSADGAAAVLAFARTMLEKERRNPPFLQNTPDWKFASTVGNAANELKAGIYRKDLVFIASVYHLLHARGDAAAMSLSSFKARLLEAHGNFIMLVRCRSTTGLSPLLLEASATRDKRTTYHLIHRFPINNVRRALSHVTDMLPDSAKPRVAAFARRVHADEALRDGRPRLITLCPADFAVRVQHLVDRDVGDVPIAKLFWKLEDLGETTGLDLGSFEARLFAAHRAGDLKLGAPTEMRDSADQRDVLTYSVVCRSNRPLPVPWGPPTRPIERKLVLHAP